MRADIADIKENQINDIQDAVSTTATQHKNEIGLSLIALGLSLLPVIIIFFNTPRYRLRSSYPLFYKVLEIIVSPIEGLPPFFRLFVILSPIAGLIAGVVSLNQGKERIGIIGKRLAITAIALPLILIALLLASFIGAFTGTTGHM